MSDRRCAGGCGTPLPEANKSGFAWGHKNGCKAPPPQSEDQQTGSVLAQPDGELPLVQLHLSEAQLDRIWQTFSLRGKGTAIAAILATHE